MKVGIVTNSAWNAANYRLGLARALSVAGHQVVVFAPTDSAVDQLLLGGIDFRHVPIKPDGLNPFFEILSILRLRAALRKEQVDVVLSFTPKGNIYSLFACCGSRRSVVPNISGLGVVFTRAGFMPAFVRYLYRLALGFASHVFFQNTDDLCEFRDSGLLDGVSYSRVPGSGVNVSEFSPDHSLSPKKSGDSLNFLMLSRALWEKGVEVYVQAARQIRRKYPHVSFFYAGRVIGDRDGAVTYQDMSSWVKEGVIEYLGDLQDVRPAIGNASCVVLPSWYREGVPRSLLEAAAMGRPIITTSTVGCKDSMIDGVTGFFVEPKSVDSLVVAMEKIIVMSPKERLEMGNLGRAYVCAHFDESLVRAQYMAVLASIMAVGIQRRFVSGRNRFSRCGVGVTGQ